MKAIELEKAYNPHDFEDRIYDSWLKGGYFSPDNERAESDKPPYVIVIPPPNVTGVLHLGHALNNSLQDILIRYHRMLGEPTLWVPGTDHAGIATQNVVDRRLRQKGIDRRTLGREKFVAETWKVKEEHHSIIKKQLMKIGCSCDWDRERFTLDEGLSRAVREVFVGLYERGLVYRGHYLVNWCPDCGTALSDDEVEYVETNGRMYHYRYPLADGSGDLKIATTRPETMLGDTAIAVHPSDDRYKAIVGKMVRLPLTDREIPVIADSYVDMTFGTGAVKVTPAHDPNDWEIGLRHKLPVINILNPDATLNENVPQRYRGKSTTEARKLVVEDLKAAGLFDEAKEHIHQVGHCYRSDTVVEPYLSEQWFVKMRPLAEKALEAWKSGEIVFFPRRWENTYVHWLEGIRDWCISRQLWWGHRIPVWYCGNCGNTIVSRTDPSTCPKCSAGADRLEQDPDVLDTWFSSWLWPFSTLGWPDKTADLDRFYSTTALVTAYDIIFFWVARMIMAGKEFMGDAPFRDIYITGLVRDKQGRKMSKSLGNGFDPLEVVDKFGADALKFTLSFLTSQGQDVLIDQESFSLGSRFANKIWNAARYLLMNLEGRNLVPLARLELRPVDRWIFHRLNEAARTVAAAMDSYRFDDASRACYEYFWNDFCDWYVEASKLSLYPAANRGGTENGHPAASATAEGAAATADAGRTAGVDEAGAEADRAMTLLMYVLEESLRLLHPFLPFLTEEIYQKLPEFAVQSGEVGRATGGTGRGGTTTSGTLPGGTPLGGTPQTQGRPRPNSIMIGHYPTFRAEREDRTAERGFSAVQELVRLVRTMRSEFTVAPSKRIRVHVKFEPGFHSANFIESHAGLVQSLTAASSLTFGAERPAEGGAVPAVGSGFEAYVFVREVIDVAAEVEKLKKDIQKSSGLLEQSARKLSNAGFVEKADPGIVAREREKHDELGRKIEKMREYVSDLEA